MQSIQKEHSKREICHAVQCHEEDVAIKRWLALGMVCQRLIPGLPRQASSGAQAWPLGMSVMNEHAVQQASLSMCPTLDSAPEVKLK